jgi:hypothetical protein
MYHAMSRRDRREDIFPGDVARHDFINTLEETGEAARLRRQSYCTPTR